MNDFLPNDVDKLEKPGNYMKWEQGDNKFRPLDTMITGWEGWKTQPDGTKKPVRKRVDEPFRQDEVDDPLKTKPFFAFPVWNYKHEMVQILEITQKTIQKSIKALVRNKDWGSPIGVDGYDITVTREGTTMDDTEYSVAPSPHKKLDEAIMKVYRDMHIRLEALYDGDDPFEETADVDLDEADKAISGS